MAKKYAKRGLRSTSKINEGHLAAQQRDVTALLDDLNHLEFSYHPDLHVVESEPEELYNYPETPILDALEGYLTNSAVPLHIPGHARGEGTLPRFSNLIGSKVIKADTTDDFDKLGQLNPAQGAIKEAQNLASKTFGAAHTFFLVNGSTVGNLSLALTVSKPGDKVIMARNCHRSVISGITTSGATPVWILPERNDEWGIWGEINPQKVKQLLEENPEAKVVWITNPTYEGVVSNVKAIADICKEHNVAFIVDEAHGCHWNFNDQLPINALYVGADAVVHSIHKTGGSFSQSSMVHLGHNSKIDSEELQCNLRMLQSTSPSYLLLASLDAARSFLDSSHGRQRIDNMVKYSNKVRHYINQIPGCRCMSASDGFTLDPTKLYITVRGLSGKQLQDILEIDFKIETEAKTDKGTLALANIGNTESELEYLYEALKVIATRKLPYQKEAVKCMPFSIPEMVCLPREAYFSKKLKVKPVDAIGKVSAEIIAICPPGIPILVPGEKIQLEHLHYIRNHEFVWVADI